MATDPGGRRAFRTAAPAAWVLVAVLVVGAACARPDVADPFYRLDGPPSATSVSAPGDLYRSRPSLFTLDPFRRDPVGGVHSWQVLHRSTDALGGDVAVSGTVLVPTAPWTGPGKRPIVGYGVGTRGVGDQCAPSWTLALGYDYEGAVILEALRRGWAVAVTDMVGLGTPGLHSYGVGREQGTALIDVVRAAQRLPGAGLGPDHPVGFWGYSQGGLSAAWAAELAPDYAPELDVAAVAAGGVPADLRASADAIDGGPFMGLVLLAALGYDAAYPELDLDAYLNERGRRLLAEAGDTCVVDLTGLQRLISVAGSGRAAYTTEDPLSAPAWVRRLDENRPGSHPPEAPVLLQHARSDQLMPVAEARRLRQSWCSQGARVAWLEHPGEHVLGALFSIEPALDHLERHFAGRPPAAGCRP